MSTARRFIRDVESREWLSENGFTHDVHLALQIPSVAQAARLSREIRGRKLQYVIRFADGEEVALPLDLQGH